MLFCYCHDLIHFHRSKKALPLHRAIPVMSMAKDAGMILSEFILLGIGGRELSEENAIQTAKALNVIQPDYIRVHATGIKPESKMGEFVRDGSFTLQSEEEIVAEQKLFLQQLQEMDSFYVNEHIINLLLEVRGSLRTEKQKMLSTIDRFLNMPPDERLLFACFCYRQKIFNLILIRCHHLYFICVIYTRRKTNEEKC